MAAFHSSCLPKDLLSSLSAEVLYIILSYLPAKSLLNVSECNRRLRDLCQNCNSLWKRLCKVSDRCSWSELFRPSACIAFLVRNYFPIPLLNCECNHLVFYLSFCVDLKTFFCGISVFAGACFNTRTFSVQWNYRRAKLPVPFSSSLHIFRILKK